MKNGRCNEDCTSEHSDERHQEHKQNCRSQYWISALKRRTEAIDHKKRADKPRTKVGYKQKVKSLSNDE